jgi:hypothetical protein
VDDSEIIRIQSGANQAPLFAFIQQYKSTALAEKRCFLFTSQAKSLGHMHCLEPFQLNSTDLSVKLKD